MKGQKIVTLHESHLHKLIVYKRYKMFIIKVFKAKEANNADNNKGNRIRTEFYNARRSHN